VFVQVWLAKHEDDGSLVMTPEGKEGLVGINCLTKIQVFFFLRSLSSSLLSVSVTRHMETRNYVSRNCVLQLRWGSVVGLLLASSQCFWCRFACTEHNCFSQSP
jgi:hypothetical protein